MNVCFSSYFENLILIKYIKLKNNQIFLPLFNYVGNENEEHTHWMENPQVKNILKYPNKVIGS